MVGILKNYKLPRLLRKYSIAEIAKGAKVNQKTLYKNLSGKTPMSLRTSTNIVKWYFHVKDIQVNDAGCELIELDYDAEPDYGSGYGAPLRPIAGLFFELDDIYMPIRKRISKNRRTNKC